MNMAINIGINMSFEQKMKYYGFVDISCKPNRDNIPLWYVGILCGPNRNIICLKECETDEEIEEWKSPYGLNVLEALNNAIEKKRLLRSKQNSDLATMIHEFISA